MDNKVTLGLKRVTLAEVTDSGTAITYGTPVPFKGAVSISLDPKGDKTDEYADDGLWYSSDNDQGFTGKLQMEHLPYEVSSLILGDLKDDNGVIVQSQQAGKTVAMMFEFDGDKKAVRHVLYNVTFSRPSEGSTTKGEKSDLNKVELEFTAALDPYLGKAKSKTDPDTNAATYDAWYDAPYRPKFTPAPEA